MQFNLFLREFHWYWLSLLPCWLRVNFGFVGFVGYVNVFLSIHSKIYLIINLASDFIMAMVMLFVMFYFFCSFEMIKAHKKRIKEIIIYVCDIMETRTNSFFCWFEMAKALKEESTIPAAWTFIAGFNISLFI